MADRGPRHLRSPTDMAEVGSFPSSSGARPRLGPRPTSRSIVPIFGRRPGALPSAPGVCNRPAEPLVMIGGYRAARSDTKLCCAGPCPERSRASEPSSVSAPHHQLARPAWQQRHGVTFRGRRARELPAPVKEKRVMTRPREWQPRNSRRSSSSGASRRAQHRCATVGSAGCPAAATAADRPH